VSARVSAILLFYKRDGCYTVSLSERKRMENLSRGVTEVKVGAEPGVH
jgi:hypothetical protein